MTTSTCTTGCSVKNAATNVKAFEGADVIVGSNDAVCIDHIEGNAGADVITANAGDDEVLAGTGADTVDGGNGDDEINGGGGDDVLDGGAGSDTIDGGAGDDIVRGQTGNDVLMGGAGADLLCGGGTSGAGQDALYSVDDGTGFEFPNDADTLWSPSGANTSAAGKMTTVVATAATATSQESTAR